MNLNRSGGQAFTEMCGRGTLPFGMMCFRMSESRIYALRGQYTLYAFINPRSPGIYENGVVNLLRVEGKTQVRRWSDNALGRGWFAVHKSNLQIP